MTKTNDDVMRFIELRAGGLSFDRISQETGTSKTTLLKWSREYQQELEQAQFFELQNILAQYGIMRRGRVDALSETLHLALTELRARAQTMNFNDLSTDKLLKLVLMLEARLERDTESNKLEYSERQNLKYILDGVIIDVD